MVCEYCGKTFSHSSGCPYVSKKKSNYYCSICKEEIEYGEEYIEHENGKVAHWECIDGRYDLIKWVGLDIKTLEDGD